MILDFNFTLASSECSDESVHLQSLGRACAFCDNKSMLMTIADRMLLIGKNFANERF